LTKPTFFIILQGIEMGKAYLLTEHLGITPSVANE